MTPGKLSVAEMFYSVQGEGRTVGIPSVFLRLAGCNLLCGGYGTQADKQLHDGATWRCDTIEVWMRGKALTFQELYERMKTDMLIKKIDNGAHLIITGGEPLMQQDNLIDFIKFLEEKMKWDFDPFIEVETNGTIVPEPYLRTRVSQWNVSPKLANSGMRSFDRINLEAINTLALQRTHGRSCIFKIVISKEEDWLDFVKDYCFETEILRHQIYLMPAVDNVSSYSEMSKMVIEICKREGVNFSPREHIAVWNQKTGV